MQIIDLSVALTAGIASDPPFMLPQIDYVGHAEGAGTLVDSFPGLRADQLPDGQGAAIEFVRISTHNGTHLDAPWHYHPTMDEAEVAGGRRAMTIDEVPLDWCLRPGVKLDLRDRPDGHVVSAAEIADAIAATGHALRPLDIVLVNTSAGAAYGRDDYLSKGCGIGREATLWLTERGVRVTGTDAWSWDAPFPATAARFAAEGDPSIIWEGHKAGRERGYCHMEKLANLEKLPAKGFTVSCFPVKVDRGSAGWVRAVAIMDADAAGTGT
jgi:kynurenine formamidase